MKGIHERIREPFPDTDLSREIEIPGEHVSTDFYNASVILTLRLAFLVTGVFALFVALPSESTSVQNVVFEVASAQGNVGLSSGITTPRAVDGCKTRSDRQYVGRPADDRSRPRPPPRVCVTVPRGCHLWIPTGSDSATRW